MDIAEIRKKAKSKSEDPEEPMEAAADQEESGLPEDEPGEACVEQTDAPDLPVADALELTTQSTDDIQQQGLDRLFAATDEFALAVDEASELVDENAKEYIDNVSQYLAFHLGQEEYALDIKRISEIIKVREFTDIPRAPEYVLGIISLRGVVVPVFDLQRRLNLGDSEMLSTSRIIVCQHDDLTVGFLVDSINQVVNLIDEEIEPPPGVLSGLDKEMVSGIGRYQGRMIILLQLLSVLDIELL